MSNEALDGAIQLLLQQINGLQDLLHPSIENIREEIGELKSSVRSLENATQDGKKERKELYEGRNQNAANIQSVKNQLENKIGHLEGRISNLSSVQSKLETVSKVVEKLKFFIDQTEENEERKEKENKTRSKRIFTVIWDIVKIAIASTIAACVTHYKMSS